MGYKFSVGSQQQLATVHPDLKLICSYGICFHDFKVLQGHRNEADQNKAFAEGKTKLKWPNGNHNKTPSEAVDILPFVNGKAVSWSDRNAFVHFAGRFVGWAEMLYTMGEIGHLVRWGGDWDRDNDQRDNSFDDLVHFELIKPQGV